MYVERVNRSIGCAKDAEDIDNEVISLSERIASLKSKAAKRRVVHSRTRSVKRKSDGNDDEYFLGLRRDEYDCENVYTEMLPIPTTRADADISKLDTKFHRYHRMHYREEYEAENGFIFGDEYEDSYILNSYWCKAEKMKFFSALERCGRHDLHGIQQRVGPTKTVYEIATFIDCLEEASQAIGGTADILSNSDPDSDLFIPHAFEMSSQWIKAEEKEAHRLRQVSEHSFLFMEKTGCSGPAPVDTRQQDVSGSETEDVSEIESSSGVRHRKNIPLTATTVLDTKALYELASRMYIKNPYAVISSDTIEYLYYQLVRFLEDLISETYRIYNHRVHISTTGSKSEPYINIYNESQIRDLLKIRKLHWKDISRSTGDCRVNLSSAADLMKDFPSRLEQSVLDDHGNMLNNDFERISDEELPKKRRRINGTKSERIRASKTWSEDQDQLQPLEHHIFKQWKVQNINQSNSVRNEEAIGQWFVELSEDQEIDRDSGDETLCTIYEADETVECAMRLRDRAYEEKLMRFLNSSNLSTKPSTG
ncbi:hypothetical protein DFQ30_001716 [Apophysomyces sp. BC1015]|nr:hypothetical protein DFQ30_001716 [Apophysomyces sp. BC1015]